MTIELLQSQLNCQVFALLPFGIKVLLPKGQKDSIETVPVELLTPLLLEHRLILLRGFAPIPEKEQFSDVCRQWGELLEWEFGTVFEVVEHADPKNYLFTSGSVPYHWDGAFANQVPWLQFFQCLEAPGHDSGGETIFCNTAALWKSLSPETKDLWNSVVIDYSTDKVTHYGGKIRVDLVESHPQTDETLIRFAEPANATTVQLNTPNLEVQGIAKDAVPAFLDELTRLIYDPRFMYAHDWQPGDFLIADNHVLLHGRTSYRQHLPRRLWRVHII